MHKAHWRPTVATVKITEFSTDRPLHVVPGQRIVAEVDAGRDELRRE